jgi:hypothetical protein
LRCSRSIRRRSACSTSSTRRDDPNTIARRADNYATQFLFISHNKITMEMANQLIGITMPDPGASRVVAVDIAELEPPKPHRRRNWR